MKVYVITISDVYDYEGFPHAPRVFTDKKKGMAALHELHDSAKAELVEQGNDDWVEDDFDEFSTSFSMYPEGSWGTSHYDAVLNEVDVEE